MNVYCVSYFVYSIRNQNFAYHHRFNIKFVSKQLFWFVSDYLPCSSHPVSGC